MPDNTGHGKPYAITVVIPTYNRPKILYQTIGRLYRYLEFDGEVRFLIGDDGGTDPVSASDLHALPAYREGAISVIPGPRRGLGANLNMLLGEVTTNVVMQMDDDHWLTAPLDINDYARDLLDKSLNVGWIRLFLGERSDVYNLKGYYKFNAANYGPYWFINPESPDLYIASNRPHIKHMNFHIHYGQYDEAKTLGKTEESWCHNYKNMRSASKKWEKLPWVVVPMLGLTLHQWQHVGESWQKEGL